MSYNIKIVFLSHFQWYNLIFFSQLGVRRIKYIVVCLSFQRAVILIVQPIDYHNVWPSIVKTRCNKQIFDRIILAVFIFAQPTKEWYVSPGEPRQNWSIPALESQNSCTVTKRERTTWHNSSRPHVIFVV